MFHSFQFDVWLMYFYCYCFIGWVFETSYVSIKDKKFTNRGFMNGPWLPIYGSGAITILLCTYPINDNPICVYFVGLLSATVLEYLTGAVMLKIFKVRYWDYSYRHIQLHGHICLVSSIVWGFFSDLLVFGIHKPIAAVIAKCNYEVINVLTFLITIIFVFDFANALRNAMDLKAALTQLEELRQRLNANMEERHERISDEWETKKKELTDNMEDLYQRLEKLSKHLLSQSSSATLGKYKDVTDTLRKRIKKKIEEKKKENPSTRS